MSCFFDPQTRGFSLGFLLVSLGFPLFLWGVLSGPHRT